MTGASSGVGLEAARLFATEGADVALLARSADGLAAATAAVEGQGRRAHAIVVDLADHEAAEAAVAQAAARLGGIDVLASNAATAGWGPFDTMTADDFDRTVAITFTGAVNAIRAALPHLDERDGTLVATVSVAGKVPVPMLAPYTAAKHALRGFLGALRIELRHRGSGVRVAMIHPAPLNTPFYDVATSAIDVQPRPLRSTYDPVDAARALVECAIKPRREVTVGGSAAMLNLAATVCKPLSDLILSSYGVRGSTSKRPATRPGALWQPSGPGLVHGSHRGRASVWTALRLFRARR